MSDYLIHTWYADSLAWAHVQNLEGTESIAASFWGGKHRAIKKAIKKLDKLKCDGANRYRKPDYPPHWHDGISAVPEQEENQ